MFFKSIMLWILTITIMMTISSNFWFIYWLMMEINLMAFIPIMNNYKLKNYLSIITYFIVQSFSSTLFFFSSSFFMLNNTLLFINILNIAILIKLAIIPFHYWILLMSESLDFFSLFILLTMQKMIPLLIIEKFMTKLALYLVIFSTIFSSMLMMKLKLFKKILILSSISHLGWILTMIFYKINFWISYLFIYALIINSLVKTCQIFNIYSINKMMMMKMSYKIKLHLVSNMMSLGGMPPFMGFFIKTFSILILMKYTIIFIFILIISSLINLFIYIRFVSSFFFLSIKNTKNLFFIFNFKKFFFKINLIMLIFMLNMFLT
uniref:NADH-ubiquinone oxidoreductase chain 2 n=1 Tax=Hyalomma marginatum TaxID=34627 RepID=A0A889Q322_9ACAR|nr:NADH dehydrogenase subunit 2 [Hyalomma marginatum]QRE78546.1 NADH dehydrogenase subunit 2 [Hyalomma marginatum]QRE78559.1 NADH dehydrogenase subunit 2 [Hyalomma marginatum]QRE78572.1 NADH dehydrogenase subunit 2 [Hyalomma marginatum]QRF92771.1 NADH dehydrogenase subunit 2 [Hyalomma marginatum]QRF92788.1 NADH dehydrogenase subunit 2 [Hyalomma marginatum]